MNQEKIDRALKLIRSIPQDGPIELCYSTGKDSDVILELAKMAEVPVVPIYKNTTCDHPGSIRHAREMGVEIRQPKANMLTLIEKSGWPSRWARFCCSHLKEYKIYDRAIVGIRRSESTARAKRYREPEMCRVYSSTEKSRQYFPILDWTDLDVAEFVEERKLKLHPRYYDKFGVFHVERRVGCIGCPMASGNGVRDYLEFPSVLKARVRAFRRWWNMHPDSKTAKKFPTLYHSLYMKLFCHDMTEYYDRTGGLFGEVDMKKWLEDYFGIDL